MLCEKNPEPNQQNEVGENPILECHIGSFSLLIYSHSLYWVAHLFLDPYLKKKHKDSRLAGYLDFYLNTKNIRRAPFYLVSVGNFMLLAATTVLHDYCDKNGNCTNRFMQVDWLRGLITVECMTIMCLFAYYIIKMREFNKLRMPPDGKNNKWVKLEAMGILEYI